VKSVPRVASHVALDSTVLILENAQNALLGSTKVRKNKLPVSCVKTANYQMKETLAVKNLIGNCHLIVTTTTSTWTIHHRTKIIGIVSRAHLEHPAKEPTSHGVL
jgi:hypothetical protein